MPGPGEHYVSLYMSDGKLGLCESCGFIKTYNQKRGRPTCSIRAREKNLGRYQPTLMREQRLRWKYGITQADYNSMVLDQKGKCLICSNDKCRLVVDHDHETGEIRGLLCSQCNTALGLMYDKIENFASAIKYLARKATDNNWSE
jgi:hypothetical protein